jgi:hypothetical protein
MSLQAMRSEKPRSALSNWVGRLVILLASLIWLGAGSGTASAAVVYQGAGTAVNGNAAGGMGGRPAWPAHMVGDVALLFVESTGGQPVTLGVANGFAPVLNSPQATGAGTAGTRLTVFWARATSSAMPAPTIAVPSDHFYAQIVTFRGVINSGNPWDVTGGGVKAAASGSVTVTGVTTTVANTLVVQAVARDNDSAAAAFSAQSNANLAGIVEHLDAGTANGNGGGLGIWSGVMAAAGATGNTTATVTGSINAFLTIALKPQAGPRFQAAGTALGGTGAVSPAWPPHAAGDIALLFVESTGGQAATLSTAAGFAAVANSPKSVGAGTAGTRLTVFWARATSAAMGAPTVADPGNHVYAQILTYRGVVNAGNPWDVTGGGTKTPASGSVSLTSVTTTVADTLVVQAVARDNDSAAAAFSAQANANLTSIAERVDAGTTQGNGGGFAVWDGYKATASATGSTTATVTSSINAFLTIALKPQTTLAPAFSATGTAVTAGLNWPLHAIDDVGLLFIETAGGEAPTLADAAGFLPVTNSPQTTGTGTAGTTLSVYWARATSTSMPGPSITAPADHAYARIITYRGTASSGNPWDVTGGGVKAAASTSVAVTGVTTTVPNTRIVQAVARDNDSAAAAFSAETNANLTGIAERNDAGTTTGLGGGFAVWDGAKATAGATGNTTATVTNSINAFLTIALRPVVTQPDHYELSLPTGTVACVAGGVTVTACANNTSPCTSPLNTLAGQTANLAANICTLGSTTVSFNGAGVATTTLNCAAAADGATVTVTLSGESTPTTPVANARQCCQNGSCTVTDNCSATNKTAGFLFAAVADGPEATIAAQQAGVTSSTYYLRAIKTNTSTLACEAALSGANSVNLAYECNNPATCSGSNLMSINGGTPTTIARNNNGSVSSYTPVTMSFDANGNAPFTLAFSDVGLARLHAAKAADGSLVPPLLTALAGASLPFVTAPFDFLVVPASPYAAGVSFGAAVTARASGGAATPNFGLESTPETVLLQPVSAALVSAANSQLVGPAGGQLGQLTAGSFTPGKCVPASGGSVCDTALAWTEVGDLVLAATLANGSGYLGSGLSPWGSAAAGPFKPAYLTTEFDTTQPCTSFTYSGQPFRIKVSAMSADNAVLGSSAAVTQNYVSTGSYAKAVTLGSDGAGACTPTTTGFANNTLAAADFDATPGVATTSPVTNVAAPLPVSYAQALGVPATVAVCAKDADGANSHGQAQASLVVRNGRLRLLNAYGSDLLPIRVPVRTDYYTGTRWTPNTDDNCTALTADAVAIGNVIQSGGSGLAFAVPPAGVAGDPTLTLAGGTATLVLTPSTPGAGGADVALNMGVNMGTGLPNPEACTTWSAAPLGAGDPGPRLNYLAGNTCGVGDTKAPAVRVRFGASKAPYIYMRERY